MKKVLSIFLALLISLMPIQAYAYENNQSELISPMYVYIDSIIATLSISSGGLASCTASATVYSTANSTNITLVLQQYINNEWQSIKSWETTNPSPTITNLSNSYNVSTGYKYRVVATAKIYNTSGTLIELQSSISTEKSF